MYVCNVCMYVMYVCMYVYIHTYGQHKYTRHGRFICIQCFSNIPGCSEEYEGCKTGLKDLFGSYAKSIWVKVEMSLDGGIFEVVYLGPRGWDKYIYIYYIILYIIYILYNPFFGFWIIELCHNRTT